MTLNEIIAEIKLLSLEERQILMHTLIDSLVMPPPQKSNLKDYRGAAAHLRNMDAQTHVNQLRDEWEHRS